MGSLDKSKYKEIIERSYNRRGGDIMRIVRETKFPFGLVYKEVQRLKKKDNYESHALAVAGVVRTVTSAYKKNDQRYDDMYQYLDERSGTLFSSCCDTPVVEHEHSANSDGEPYFVCSRCMKPCTFVYLNPRETMDLKLRILISQQKAIDSYVKNMDVLGVSERVEPPQFKVGNIMNVTVNKSGQKENDYIELDPETERDVDAISPMDRERIIKKIESRIMEDILAESGYAECEDGETSE